MTTKCPSHELLRRYIIGDYDDREGATIERHLESCPVCEVTLAAFDDSTDTLVRHLPLAVGPGADDEPVWLQRLATAAPLAVDETPIDLSSTATHAISGLESYELQAVNAYWGSHSFDQVTEVDRVLFQTLRYYAMTGSPFDGQSSIDRTCRLLMQWLERYYGPADALPIDEDWESLLPGRPDEMLATIVNLGRELPSEILDAMPRSKSARESLVRYQKLISSSAPDDQWNQEAKSVVGTLAVAPVQTVQTVLKNKAPRAGLDHQRMLMIAAPERVNGPPMDPILLMMISHSAMEGDDGETVVLAMQNLMFGDAPKLMFQHFKDALESPMTQKMIVINRLVEIAMVEKGPMLNQLLGFDELVSKAIIQRQSQLGGGGFM